MSNVAIIPARGGSKRIPRKNIREFCGKPMIAWSIEAAKRSELFERIIVSTDDDEVATVAEKAGAEVPFRRPENLSDDYTPTVPVICHAINWLKLHRESPDLVCCLYATAPFVEESDLLDGYHELVENPGTEFAFSATSFTYSIFRALRLNANGTIGMFWPENEKVRSQDLEEAYHDAGQFYWGTIDAWLNNTGLFAANTRIVKLPPQRVQDIDNNEDWVRAEAMYRVMSMGGMG